MLQTPDKWFDNYNKYVMLPKHQDNSNFVTSSSSY